MKRIGLVLGVVVLLALATLLVTRLKAPDVSAVATVPRAEVTAPPPPAARVVREEPPAAAVVTTDEPGLYAAAIAAVVFGMDTRAHAAADYREVLLAEADPTLSETGLTDLERLVDERVPADDQWQRMRDNAQWSAFVVMQTWEPGSWQQVVTSGEAEPGWAMRNVTGIQTTHYFDGAEPGSASRERTITVGMRCPADRTPADQCSLVMLGASVVP